MKSPSHPFSTTAMWTPGGIWVMSWGQLEISVSQEETLFILGPNLFTDMINEQRDIRYYAKTKTNWYNLISFCNFDVTKL